MSAARCPVPLVLASASPRRQQILREAGYVFSIVDPGEAEAAVAAGPAPEDLAVARARSKAQKVACGLNAARPSVVIGADTLAALGTEVIGKPLDRFDAERILTRLSGTRHRVITGLCLWLAPGHPMPELAAETSWVVMRPVSRQAIAAYVASGEADGKAGAYAVQETGDRFVERIEGSFLNVVGFPLECFERMLPEALKRWGVVTTNGTWSVESGE